MLEYEQDFLLASHEAVTRDALEREAQMTTNLRSIGRLALWETALFIVSMVISIVSLIPFTLSMADPSSGTPSYVFYCCRLLHRPIIFLGGHNAKYYGAWLIASDFQVGAAAEGHYEETLKANLTSVQIEAESPKNTKSKPPYARGL